MEEKCSRAQRAKKIFIMIAQTMPTSFTTAGYRVSLLHGCIL